MNHALHYCLDTDMCIYLLNGHPRVKTRVAEVGVTVHIPRMSATQSMGRLPLSP